MHQFSGPETSRSRFTGTGESVLDTLVSHREELTGTDGQDIFFPIGQQEDVQLFKFQF